MSDDEPTMNELIRGRSHGARMRALMDPPPEPPAVDEPPPRPTGDADAGKGEAPPEEVTFNDVLRSEAWGVSVRTARATRLRDDF